VFERIADTLVDALVAHADRELPKTRIRQGANDV
jgi:hypothetical protein